MSAFDCYAPFLQEYIYRKGWENLRDVQEEACSAILDGDGHVIIASGTASGKTEAAFFPILTELSMEPSETVGILYIGPLKALINDQNQRLTGLLQEQEIPVWPWHGDISQVVKDRARRENRGIVQITPESLEAMLMLHKGDAKRLFADLRYVVIDEIHAFMGTDRGLQLLCLLQRLEKWAGCHPRRIGLSATLHDAAPACAFLSAGTKKETVAVGMQPKERKIALAVESFPMPLANEEEAERERAQFLYEHCHTKKSLIFTNSRAEAERTILSLRQIARERGDRDIFFVHHGSISAEQRAQAEQTLREENGPAVAAATLTLELGIDIGDLDEVVQIGAPHTCASFVQRLGRSGRRTGKSKMLFVSCDGEGDELPLQLLKAIAVVQLTAEERFIEPFRMKQKPFSLLAHQTLSILAMHGEMRPSLLAREVLTLAPFRENISQEEYKQLLRFLLEKEIIAQMEDGALIIGLQGEKLIGNYTFYAVFADTRGFSVLAPEGEIGEIGECLQIGATFLLAGRMWQVDRVDEMRKVLHVLPAQKAGAKAWHGSMPEVHAKIAGRIGEILAEDEIYPYLKPSAREQLETARKAARATGMAQPCILQGEGGMRILPWTGTRELRTIMQLLKNGMAEQMHALSAEADDISVYLRSGISKEEFCSRVLKFAPDLSDPSLVLRADEAPLTDKYDFLVPPELLRKAYLCNETDVPGALRVLKELASGIKSEYNTQGNTAF